MPISRVARLKAEKFAANITKRGLVVDDKAKKSDVGKINLSPLLLGFIFFVLVGSSIFQIIRACQTGPMF